ncbi:hypothetical protein [Sulfitobacter sp. W074]|uniref:hypothetical protein n=1 Tax=Sulfitobacter sp. W074 TaxID=2867026 RepID=UPI0021A7B707|nr:hypothetical protein [Sulfitobacter sp. W074]UWR36134.1 hypothetical protein K3762_09955 [Sulfitobacter sp. W074]
MALAIRMILYAASAFIAGLGWASFDEAAGTITVNIDDIVTIIAGALTFAGTFIASRLAKARGGKT